MLILKSIWWKISSFSFGTFCTFCGIHYFCSEPPASPSISMLYAHIVRHNSCPVAMQEVVFPLCNEAIGNIGGGVCGA